MTDKELFGEIVRLTRGVPEYRISEVVAKLRALIAVPTETREITGTSRTGPAGRNRQYVGGQDRSE